MRHNRRYKPEERAQHVADYRASGLTQGQFAARAGITVSALQNWLYSAKAKLAREPAPGGFVRVAAGDEPTRGGVVVHVGDRIVVAFDSTPDANYLAALVRAFGC